MLDDVKMDKIEQGRNMPSSRANSRGCLYLRALRVEKGSNNFIFDEILRRDLLKHAPRVLVDAEVKEVVQDDDDDDDE